LRPPSPPQPDRAEVAGVFDLSNCFMNVPAGMDGRFLVLPPVSRAGDVIRLRAAVDRVIGLAACPACAGSGGTFRPIRCRIGRSTIS
jgi:uncharacterized protein YcgI (DUF1989 family)